MKRKVISNEILLVPDSPPLFRTFKATKTKNGEYYCYEKWGYDDIFRRCEASWYEYLTKELDNGTLQQLEKRYDEFGKLIYIRWYDDGVNREGRKERIVTYSDGSKECYTGATGKIGKVNHGCGTTTAMILLLIFSISAFLIWC